MPDESVRALSPTIHLIHRHSFHSGESSLPTCCLQSTHTSLLFYTDSAMLSSPCCPFLFSLAINFGYYFMAAR